jgi:uncharacterized protein (TIGR00299 family) protein
MIGYLDTPSGISGDMFLACLIDAGWAVEALRANVDRLALPEDSWSIEAKETTRGPLRALFVDVETHEPSAERRNLGTIRDLIEAADLPPAVRRGAIGTFERLAAAEAKVHGTTVDEVHFHEVGALDAIIDIVGTVAGLHAIGIDRLYASPLPLGHGWVDTEHGRMPLPAPATLELLAAVGAPTVPAPGPGELVTPTGAALLAELATFEQPRMTLSKIATGCGRKELGWANVVRLWLGDPPEEQDEIVQLEANIDDMNPQFFAVVSDRLFEAGALDVWLAPVQMKKQRPGVVLGVLAPASSEVVLADIILRETTSLGVRVRPVRRHEAGREIFSVETPFGQVRVKIKRLGDEIVGAMPEFEDCRRLADQHGVSIRTVHDAAISAQQKGRDRPQS